MATRGLRELQVTLRRLPDGIAGDLRQVVDRSASIIADRSARFAPPPRLVFRVTKAYKHRGPLKQMKQSFTVALAGQNLEATISNTAPHHKFVELGTGRRGTLMQPNYKPSGYVYGSRPGMVSQPMLYPSWEQEGHKFLEQCKRVVRRRAVAQRRGQ